MRMRDHRDAQCGMCEMLMKLLRLEFCFLIPEASNTTNYSN